MRIGDFLKASFDIYQPKKKKRADEETTIKTRPFIVATKINQHGTEGDNASNVAAQACRLYNKNRKKR